MKNFGAEPRADVEGPLNSSVWWKVVGEPTWVWAQFWYEARQKANGKPVEIDRRK